MADHPTNNPDLEQKVIELTADLQRIQADFINYRRRIEEERQNLNSLAKAAAVTKLLPIVDDIERAVAHTPPELAGDKWAQGIASLAKNLQKSLQDIGIARVEAQPGTPFDPTHHEAISMDDSEGEQEVVGEELRAGYKLGEHIVRPAMVKVTRQPGTIKPDETVVQELKNQPPETGGPED